MIDFHVTHPAIGSKYWWLKSCKDVTTLTVLEIVYIERSSPGRLTPAVNPCEYRLRVEGLYLEPAEVTWTVREWAQAVQDRKLTDWMPPPTLGPGEEFCPMCHGERWEPTRDSEYLPCVWCRFEGKRLIQPAVVVPKKVARSPLHPEMPT